MPAVPVTTPSEQRNFIQKVRGFIKDADLAGFASLLGAAEYSAQSTDGVDVKEEDSQRSEMATSPRGALAPITSFTPESTAAPVPNSVRKVSDSEPSTPKTAELRRQESINTQINRSTPGSSATGFGAAEHVLTSNSLVAKSLNRIERGGKSLLMEVASISDPAINQTLLYSMCMLLLEHGANPTLADSQGNMALHYAAQLGHERVGRLLLTKGCPINSQNRDGDAATHIAARHGMTAFLEMLADLGANFHLRNGNSVSALDLVGTSARDSEHRLALRRVMLQAEPRLRSLVLYHEDFQEHTARRPSDWEGPDRLETIMKRLRDSSEFPDYELEISNRFDKAGVELLGRVHSPEYIAFVNMLSKQVQKEGEEAGAGLALPFTPQVQKFMKRQTSEELKTAEAADTSFSVGTLKAARRAAGAVAHAVDRVMLGRNRNVFCAVRPPGHHAGYRGLLDGANSCGFCIFNSVAAGALHALEEHHCERVAIIDLDVHHGNGTEDIVRRYTQPSRLLFFSLHLYDKDEAHSVALPAKTTTDRPIDAATSAAEGDHLLKPGSSNGNAPPAGTTSAPPGDSSNGGTNTVTTSTTPTSVGPSPRSYEFYPGTGARDDIAHNIINVPLLPLWAAEDQPFATNSSPKRSTRASQSANTRGMLMGREGYRQAIETRLIPSLRAFNPSLILLSIGFDAAAGDVGNCRYFPGVGNKMGIDLTPDDFAWATTEISKIADMCCNGKLVSVLEGGYGEYNPVTPSGRGSAVPAEKPSTRGSSRSNSEAKVEVKKENAPNTSSAIPPAAPFSSSSPAPSIMNRSLLAKVAAAHVHRMIDPYGPPMSHA